MTAAAPGVPVAAPEPRPPKVRTRPGTSLFEPSILRRAAPEAFAKLDPRTMVRNPVMFVVEIGSVVTTAEFAGRPSVFVGLVTLWLWATVLFANLAEAVAEGRGKAQADTLRAAARKPRPGACGRTAVLESTALESPALESRAPRRSRPPSSGSATCAW